MLFLTSLVFVGSLYVIPGVWPVDLLSRMLEMPPWISARNAFLGLSGVLYLLSLYAVRLAGFAYGELRLEKEKTHRILQSVLDVRGCGWIHVTGLATLSGVALVLLARGALPYQFGPLFAAIALGFANLLSFSDWPAWKEELPPLRFSTVEPAAMGQPGWRAVSLCWEYLKRGSSPERVRFDKTYGVQEDQYEMARGRARFPRSPLSEYGRYVREPPHGDIQRVALDLRGESERREYSPLQEVENAVALVRSIAYATDETTHGCPDYANFPVETLAEERGDCEDHAILAASLLHQMGHDVALFFLELGGSGHLALGYHAPELSSAFSVQDAGGTCYAYVETVPGGEAPGDIPAEFLRQLRSAVVIPLGG